MEKISHKFNLTTSIIIDVFFAIYFTFTSLEVGTVRYYLSPTYYKSISVNYYSASYGCCIASLIVMWISVIAATACLIIDILHMTPAIKETKIYRYVHELLVFISFGTAVAAIALNACIMACYGTYTGSLLCFFFSIFITALELARLIVGARAIIVGPRLEREYRETPKEERRSDVEEVSSRPTPRNSSDIAVNKLRDLKKLLDDGIITEEEFLEAKKKYVKDL